MRKNQRSKQRSSLSVKQKSQFHSSSKQTTSPTYSQLQIILQSVQKIKQTTQKQIKLLQQQNSELKIEREALRELLSGSNKRDSDILLIQQRIEQKYRQEIQKYKTVVNELTKQRTKLQISLQRANSKSEVLEKQIEQLNETNRRRMNILKSHEKCLRQIGFSISQQNKIEDKNSILSYLYQKDLTVPSLIKQVQNLKLECKSSSEVNQKLKSEYEQVFQQKQRLIQNIKHLQSELQISKQVIEKGVEQIQYLSQQLSERQAQIRKQQELMCKSQKQSDLQIHNLGKILQQKSKDYESHIKSLLQDIQSLNQFKTDSELKQKQMKGLSIYQKIVGQACQASQKLDYQRVSTRIQYLQRFKSEYYYNVQKIQYLCKMLDI